MNKMKHFKALWQWWGLCGVVVMSAALAACQQRHATASEGPRHLVTADKRGEMLYVDRLDNRAILQREDSTGSTHFCSFLVGWRDSLPASDPKRAEDKEKYIQYHMQQDWTVLAGGDSLKPVFLQEKPHMDDQLREAALVFEIPRGSRADTLVYRDTWGDWGVQVFILNEK
jgi:hypothetical protein